MSEPALTATRLDRVGGRYEIYGAFASGGMASVHFGRMVGAVGFARTVAIKRLHANFARDPEFVAMFMDEARIASRIRHPNVVSTLDIVSFQDELFVVMEYVHGESLAQLARLGRQRGSGLPPAIASAIVLGALAGLHAAHEATDERGAPLSIVHRDVSPQNILVGADGIARVLDFGVAKAADRLQTTREGQVKGKFSYMAPEQLSALNLDRTADLYAMGVILWELLAGRRLFYADSPAAICAMVMNPPPRPLLAEAVPGVLSLVDDLITRAQSPTPADRFRTAREMAAALARALPPATQSEVSVWIEGQVDAELVRRAAYLAAIEASAELAPSFSGVLSGPYRVAIEMAAGRDLGNDVTMPDAVTSRTPPLQEPFDFLTAPDAGGTQGSVSMVVPPSKPMKKRPIPWLPMTGIALALALAAKLMFSPDPGPPAASIEASPRPGESRLPSQASARVDPSSASAAQMLASPHESDPRTVPSAPIPTPSSNGLPVQRTPLTGATKKKAAAGGRHSQPPASNCLPPYVVDARGIQHLKPECL